MEAMGGLSSLPLPMEPYPELPALLVVLPPLFSVLGVLRSLAACKAAARPLTGSLPPELKLGMGGGGGGGGPAAGAAGGGAGAGGAGGAAGAAGAANGGAGGAGGGAGGAGGAAGG